MVHESYVEGDFFGNDFSSHSLVVVQTFIGNRLMPTSLISSCASSASLGKEVSFHDLLVALRAVVSIMYSSCFTVIHFLSLKHYMIFKEYGQYNRVRDKSQRDWDLYSIDRAFTRQACEATVEQRKRDPVTLYKYIWIPWCHYFPSFIEVRLSQGNK